MKVVTNKLIKLTCLVVIAFYLDKFWALDRSPEMTLSLGTFAQCR